MQQCKELEIPRAVFHFLEKNEALWLFFFSDKRTRIKTICLPLRETYIVFPSVYVRPSVRPCVRPCVRPFVCNAFLIRAISPRTFRAKNLQKIRKITYLLKLCNKKSKFNFAKNFGSFGQKTTFWICVLSRPDLGNYKR